jgi:Tfp pilus assembly protein PilX
MKALSQKSREKGMALLVAMFTLVLLSVIGLGLMYSTNMETIINSNYRDKQVSMYGALSGLQEARDRLQPAAPSMPLPTDMPTLTNHQVFYIIKKMARQSLPGISPTNTRTPNCVRKESSD